MKLPVEKTEDAQPEGSDQDAVAGISVFLTSTRVRNSFDWRMMLVLFFPITLEALDFTIVATAQSRIASVFNALPLESYIGTSYLLASTVFLPLFASITDIYGCHFALQLSLLFFLLGSSLSTGAQNMAMLLAGRGVAGMGAAGILNTIRTVVSDEMSLDKNNLQQSALYLLYVVGFTVGPMTGGYLAAASFRWVFAINLPCTVLAMLLGFIFLRKRSSTRGANDEELQGATPRRMLVGTVDTWVSKITLMDWVGTLLFVSGGILVLLGLNWGPDDNWKSTRVINTIVLGGLLITIFFVWETLLGRWSTSLLPNSTGQSSRIRTKGISVFCARPMIPIELFMSYDMCVVQYDSFVSGIVVFVMFYFVSIFTTVVIGASPGSVGIQLLYFAPGICVGFLISIWMINKFRQPIYPILLSNAILTVGVGLIQMAMQYNMQKQVDGFMVMIGAAAGIGYNPLMFQARFARLKLGHADSISDAMILFFRALGGTVGLAQCYTILNANVNAHIRARIESLESTLSLSDFAALASLLENGGLTSITSINEFPSVVQDVVRNAFRNGVRWSFMSLVPWACVGCVVSVFLSKIEDPDRVEGGRDGVERLPSLEPEVSERREHGSRICQTSPQ